MGKGCITVVYYLVMIAIAMSPTKLRGEDGGRRRKEGEGKREEGERKSEEGRGMRKQGSGRKGGKSTKVAI